MPEPVSLPPGFAEKSSGSPPLIDSHHRKDRRLATTGILRAPMKEDESSGILTFLIIKVPAILSIFRF